MKVELIEATDNPEVLVCKAARNDYRSDGIIDYSLGEIMRVVEPDEEIHEEVMASSDWRPESINGVWHDHPHRLEAKNRTLLTGLMDDGHWGPFEHPQATVAIEGITRVATHQIVRHRHFTYDQQSMRFVTVDDVGDDEDKLFEAFQMPEFRGEDFDVDREGVHEIEDMKEVKETYKSAYSQAADAYQTLLDNGVPKEQARKVLPTGTKTNIVMSGNARAWMHFFNIRTKANVQGETRRAAEAALEELKEWMPYTFEKYEEDVLPLKLNP